MNELHIINPPNYRQKSHLKKGEEAGRILAYTILPDSFKLCINNEVFKEIKQVIGTNDQLIMKIFLKSSHNLDLILNVFNDNFPFISVKFFPLKVVKIIDFLSKFMFLDYMKIICT